MAYVLWNSAISAGCIPLLKIAGRAVLHHAWTLILFSHPPKQHVGWRKNNYSSSTFFTAQLFQNVSTFKYLWHSQTGSFTNAWQLHSYLFLVLSNTLQKAAKNAKHQDYHVLLSLKNNTWVAMSYYFTACKMSGVISEFFPGTDSSEI